MPLLNRNISGIYEGVIVDNYDYDKTNRVQVRIPSLHGSNKQTDTGINIGVIDEDLPWAHFSMPFYPMSFIPPIGTVVFVTFLNNNPDRPLVIGCRANYTSSGSDIPFDSIGTSEVKTSVDNNYVQTKSLTTRIFTIAIDDQNAILTINSGGLRLELDVNNNIVRLGGPVGVAVQKAVLGDLLQSWWNTATTGIKDLFNNHGHMTGVGPSSGPMPGSPGTTSFPTLDDSRLSTIVKLAP